MTLKNKLSLIVSALFLSLFVIVTAVLVRLAEQTIKKSVGAQQQLLALATANDVDQRLASTHNALVSAARALSPSAIADAKQLRRYLESNSALYPMFYNVLVYSPDGTVLANYPLVPDYEGRDLGNLEYIQKTRTTGKPYISKPFISPVSKQPLIVMTAPVLDADGRLRAILGGGQYFLQQNVFASIIDTKIGETGYYSLITQDRVIVATPERTRIMQTIAAGANLGLEAALKNSVYSGETTNSKGVPVLASFQTLKSTGWLLVASLPIEEAYQPIRQLRKRVFGAVAVLGVVLPLVVWLVMRQLTQPIIALRDRIRSMAANVEVVRLVDASRRDEIGEVAQAFNDLTAARNRVQLALREQEAVLHGFFEASNVHMSIIEVVEDDFIYVLPNLGIAQFYGLTVEQMTGKRASELGLPQRAIHSATEQFRRCLDTGQPIETEFELTLGGQRHCQYVYFSPLSFNDSVRPRIGLIAIDITERKLAQQRVERLSKLYAALSETSQAIVREHDRAGLLQRICDIAVEHAEFKLAWIGIVNTHTLFIEPVAKAGKEGALPYVAALRISTDPEAPKGNVPTALALRTGKEYVCNNFATDPAMLPNLAHAQQHGFGCGAAFPLREGGEVVGALVVYAEEVEVFHGEILTLLREMAEDISFAFDNFVKEAARRQAESQLRHLFAASPAAIILQYPIPDKSRFKLGAVSISPAIERMTGYTAAEWLSGEPTKRWLERVHPDDAPSTIARQKVLRKNGELLTEYRLRHKDGSYRLIQDNAVVVRDDSGRIVEVIRVWFDITEHNKAEAALHESEEQFRDLVDTTRDVIYALTTDGVITTLNPAFETVTGWPRSEWIGKHYGPLMHPEDVDLAAKMHQGLLRGGLPVPFRLRIRTRTGGYAVLEIQASVRQREGQEMMVLGIGRDLTERLNLEAQLRQSQKMEAIGQLAGGIAHDFNNILTAIVGNSRLARGDLAPTHPAQESLAEIEKATQRAIDLVSQILTFGRQREQQRKPLKLQGIVEEALKLMRATLPATIEIHTRFAADTPVVLVDATEIHQLLMNLISNAADAMQDRDGKLQVILEPIEVDAEVARTQSELSPGRYAHLAIRDTGTGMDAATMEHIFEPFFTTKGLGQGTGLGLSVVHGIVKNHDGGVNAESQPGCGATFHIYLPAIDAAVEDETPSTPTVSSGKGEHILFVDDEEALVFLAKRTLERMGYRVSAFIYPLEALAAFARDPHGFDAVVTDISMPKMPGPELAARLLQIRRDIPIIMTSGYVRPEDTEAAHRMGVREIVVKPRTITEFAEILRGALAGTRQNAAPTPPR